jgi:hypothetical protein
MKCGSLSHSSTFLKRTARHDATAARGLSPTETAPNEIPSCDVLTPGYY